MLTKRAQEAINAHHPPKFHEAHEQIIVECKLKAGIDSAGLFVNAPSPETRFLRNIVPTLHCPGAMLGQNPIPGDDIVFVNEDAMAVDRVHFRMRSEISGDEVQ